MASAFETTLNLQLPMIMPSQAQHVTHNEALGVLDMLVQTTVQDRTRHTPPEAPAVAQCHIVAVGAEGAWEGRNHQLACFVGNGWSFLAPQAGWRCYVAEEAVMCIFDGAAWREMFHRSQLQQLSLLGVGTQDDASNPFAAKLDKALWTARYDSDGSSGDLRYTLNKQRPGNTMSLLFQADIPVPPSSASSATTTSQ